MARKLLMTKEAIRRRKLYREKVTRNKYYKECCKKSHIRRTKRRARKKARGLSG